MAETILRRALGIWSLKVYENHVTLLATFVCPFLFYVSASPRLRRALLAMRCCAKRK